VLGLPEANPWASLTETAMAENPKIPGTRPGSKAAEWTNNPEITATESKPCTGDSRCQSAHRHRLDECRRRFQDRRPSELYFSAGICLAVLL